jgi:uncharacterized membrane protein (UPF0127 family)
MLAFIPLVAYLSAHPHDLQSRIQIRLGNRDCQSGQIFDVDVARSDAGMKRGFSGRSAPLGEAEGMLFLRGSPGQVVFWMKGVYVPLAIGFFDSKGRLASAEEMQVETDPTDPKRLYHSRVKALAVLEVAPGTFKSSGNRFRWLCVRDPG